MADTHDDDNDQGDGVVSVQRTIAADAATIFELLANPSKHPLIDGSGSVRNVRGEPERLSLGSKFGMDMRIGLPYRVTNTVTEFEDGRRIAWRHLGGWVWRYILEPVEGGGTKVTEQFDARPSKAAFMLKVMRTGDRNRPAMEETLDRLDRQVTGKQV